MYSKTTLKNGLRLITVPRDDTQSVTVLVLVGAGSRNETRKINGVAHFVEHMMFKGTRKRPTTLDISRELDRYGADYNAYTGKDITGYYIKINSDHLDLALSLLSDMLQHSKFESREVDRERSVILEEIKMYNDNPLMHVPDLFEQILYGDDHQLGWPIAGPSKVIAQMPRDDLVGFHTRHYVPKNIIVGVAGNYLGLGEAELQKKVAKYFSFARRSGMSKEPRSFNGYRSSKRVLLEKKETEQVQIALGVPGVTTKDSARFSLALLSVILGGTMSSRLFIRVRERLGLAYYVRSDSSQYSDAGSFSVQAGVDPGKLDKAIRAIMKEVDLVVRKGVTARELADAKEFVKGKMTLALEDSSALADWFVKQELYTGKVVSPEERLKKLEKITREDVGRVAKKIFKNGKFYMSAIGSFVKGDEERFSKLLRME